MNKAFSFSCGILFLMWLVFFSPLVSGHSVYFLDDLKIIYLPLEHIYGMFQESWQLPLWSTEFGFGQPVLSWGQLGFFTPVHVILRFLQLQPLTLLQGSVAIYFALGLGGFFMWLTKRRLSPLAAALGAIIFVFSGFSIGHLNHVNFYTATMLLPWLLLAVDYFLSDPRSTLNPTWFRARPTIYLALIAAAIALSGQPQVVLYTFLIVLLYSLFSFAGNLQRSQSRLRYAGLVILATCFALLLFLPLSSFATLPLKEFLPLTERADALSEEELLDFSYPPYHAITLFFPYFFGNHDFYWGPKGFQELAAFTGIIPLMLSGVALISWRSYKKEKLWAIVLIVLGLSVALGQYSPLYRYLVTEKILTTLSIPGRFVFFIDVGVALLAALGLQSLLSTWPTAPLRQQTKYLFSGLAVPVLLLIPFALHIWNDVSLQTVLWQQLSWHRPEPWLIGGAVLVFTATILWRRVQPYSSYALLLLTAGTLLTYSWSYNPRTSRTEAFRTSPLVSALQQERSAGSTPPRLYSRDQLLITLPPALRKNTSLPVSPTELENTTLARHLNVMLGASGARWIGALSIKPYREFIEEFFANDGEPIDGDNTHVLERHREIFNMAGVTHFIQYVPDGAIDRMPENNFEIIATDHIGSGEARLYRNPTAYPKAFLVPNAIFQPVAHEARIAMDQPDFNPKEIVYIDGPTPPEDLLSRSERPPELQRRRTELTQSGSATITRYEPTQVDIAVSTPDEAWLVLTDSSTPQWQTFIDDAQQPYYTANTFFKTARVPAGEHTISFRYASPATKQAKLLTLTSLAIALVLLILPPLMLWHQKNDSHKP